MTATQPACPNRSLVDRYLLGELPDGEARAFEEHYFDCPVCGEELRLAGTLLDGVRGSLTTPARTAEMPAVLAHEQAEARPAGGRVIRPSRWRWPVRVAAAASLPLAAAAGFLALVVLPRLHREIALHDRPRALAPTTLRPLTRGPADVTRLAPAPGDRFVTVQLAVRPPLAPAYRARLLDAADRPAASFGELVVPAPAPGEPIQILIPLRGLSSGRYALEITPRQGGNDGGKQTSPERYRFSLDMRGGFR